MNKKGFSMNMLSGFIILLFVIGILGFTFIMALAALQKTQSTSTTITAEDDFLVGNGTTSVLTYNFGSNTPQVRVFNSTFLNFGVDDDYVYTNATINIALNHSYSIWFNTSYMSLRPITLLTFNDTTEKVIMTNGQLIHQIQNGTTDMVNESFGQLNDSTWHNIVVTINADNKNASLYVDGALSNSTNISSPLGIGLGIINFTLSENITAKNWTGYIDEVRLYNTTLTAAQALTINQSGRQSNASLLNNGLQLWLPLNENQGSTAYDLSGKANNGTIFGATYKTDTPLYSLASGTNFITTGGQNFILTDLSFAWSSINVTYGYSNSTSQIFDTLAKNTYQGYATFFGFSQTWFALLSILVLVILIGAIIYLVKNIEAGTARL